MWEEDTASAGDWQSSETGDHPFSTAVFGIDVFDAGGTWEQDEVPGDGWA